MEITKEITINFTEKEKEAMKIIIEIANNFSQECGDNPNCNKCPLNAFCFGGVFIDSTKRIEMIINSLKRIISREEN